MASTDSTPPGASRPIKPGHSGPLRYANAQDLPSYPSPGLKSGDAAASAAATLGWASSPASGHQKQPSSPPSRWVSTAANLAFRASKTPPPHAESLAFARQNSLRAAKGVMANSRPRARSTPQTPTEKSSDPFHAGSDALSAATIAHHGRPTRSSTISAGEAGAVPYTTMSRQMFTSHPPVKPEVDEKNRAEVLHASAIAMAKKMWDDQQQKMVDSSARAHGHARTSSLPGGPADMEGLSSSRNEEQQPPSMAYGSLQEAAYRLAQERLAKLQEEHQKQRSLQDHYAVPAAPQPHRSRFGSIKSKLTRKRSSSDGDLPVEDRQRSEHIRRQMSLLNNRLSEVDGEKEKRAQDRKALLAAAQRNVKAQLHAMDAKVQSDTGRVPQGNMDDWGRKALVAARARFDASNENAGKVDLGGGKFMERAEVERIAAGRIQPLLDEINEKAEKEQERREEERLAEERRKEEAERDRMRDKEIQEIHKKLKDQQKLDEKAREAEIKHVEQHRKDEERAAKAEQKQVAKQEKAKEEEVLSSTTGQAEAPAPSQPQADTESKPSTGARHVRALSIRFPKRPSRTPKDLDTTVEKQQHPSSADESTSPKQKVRAWLLSRFPRPRAKSAGTAPAAEQATPDGNPPTKRGFIGGVALARLRGNNASTPSVVERQGTTEGADKTEEDNDNASNTTRHDSSMREVAMAGRRATTTTTTNKGEDEPGEGSMPTTTTTTAAASARAVLPSTPPQRPISQVSQASVPISMSERLSVSSMRSSSRGRSISSSSSGGEDKFVEARSEPETTTSGAPLSTTSNNLTPPPRVILGGQGIAGRVSPFRESRFSEILE